MSRIGKKYDVSRTDGRRGPDVLGGCKSRKNYRVVRDTRFGTDCRSAVRRGICQLSCRPSPGWRRARSQIQGQIGGWPSSLGGAWRRRPQPSALLVLCHAPRAPALRSSAQAGALLRSKLQCLQRRRILATRVPRAAIRSPLPASPASRSRPIHSRSRRLAVARVCLRLLPVCRLRRRSDRSCRADGPTLSMSCIDCVVVICVPFRLQLNSTQRLLCHR